MDAGQPMSQGEGASQESLGTELEAGLRESLPGLVVLDRELTLGPGVCADLAARDAAGRLVLVLRVDGADEVRPVLAALDALAAAHAQRALLVRHLATAGAARRAGGEEHLAADREPLVVLVAEGFAPPVLERLAPLCPERVRLFEVRALRSAAASSTFLCPVDEAPRGDGDPAGFLERLEEPLRAHGALLCARLAHVDAEVRCATAEGGLLWSYHGAPLCRVHEQGGHLWGQLPGEDGERPLEDDGDLEAFLDAVLVRWLELVEPVVEELAQVELVPGAPTPVVGPAGRDALHP